MVGRALDGQLLLGRLVVTDFAHGVVVVVGVVAVMGAAMVCVGRVVAGRGCQQLSPWASGLASASAMHGVRRLGPFLEAAGHLPHCAHPARLLPGDCVGRPTGRRLHETEAKARWVDGWMDGWLDAHQ